MLNWQKATKKIPREGLYWARLEYLPATYEPSKIEYVEKIKICRGYFTFLTRFTDLRPVPWSDPLTDLGGALRITELAGPILGKEV
jgi:hypothetical protein